MKKAFLILLICCQGILLNVSCGSGSLFEPDKRNALRAPSYPLISVDPYTSVWSFADELNADVTRHWTGKEQALLGVVDVDGVSYRFMGKETPEEGASVRFATAARQLSVNVLPTQTYYTFECGPVLLDVVFTAPLLLDDLDRMSMPVNYISWQVRSADQKKHEVRVSVEAFSSLAVNTEDQAVMVEREVENGISYLKTGTAEQAVLLRKGDDVRIDWGYFYLAAQVEKETVMEVGDRKQLVYSHILEAVSSSPKAGFLMVGYDDLYAIQYFKDNRMAYWKHNGKKNIRQAFEESAKEYRSVMERCRHFDTRLMEDAEKAGGKEYAELCAIAYRQAVAAHKLIEDKDGNLLFLSKENFSNGSIGTVDVTYPSAPLFLLYNPELLKGMLNPIFHYSESGRWNKPFAAHDVGTYPHANGQTYPFDMPVEECGNMLILTTAIALREGNADYAREHWKTLGVWANYLLKEGLDPENQLCTDDFAGHLAHNANLSIKAIIGIAGYGKLAEMLGDKEQAVRYVSAAREMAEKWERMADDGDHYRLTFDRENTWSQKYNLVWDRVLGLHIFPDRIARKEVAFYLSRQQAVAAHKLIEDKDGNLLFLSKENFSNGSIGTVDVTYPSAPLFLLYNPELLKGMLNPIFHYSESGRWNKPFAAHDVGTYPHANGQTYPFDMPVEECGNMLILTTAIALREGNADYAREHWKTLGVWANYLLKEGLDPENQLCTDDFAGHLAHNANLSIKAIIGIAGYGKLAEMLGDKEQAVRYVSAAREMAEKWERMADDGDHYRLTFDRENTWSQKYNLVWDRVLGLHIFPDRIARKEVAFYLSRQQPFGLPLDSRKTYTKIDWILWTACLADTQEDFSRLLSPAYKYVNETEPRVPLTDWYEATDGRSINMRARSVVGGFFMKMLEKQMYKPSFRPEPAEEPVVEAKNTYRNPVIDYSLPDPTIIKADDGYFYLYATEDIRNTPIHRSRNLVDWEEIGTAFTEETRPTFEPKGGLWAPDINYINGQYVLYYSMSVWGGEWTCGIGVATSDKPEGPFIDKGPLFRSKTIQVQNSIDQFFMEDNGKKYLFWGSFRGIYGIELSGDGLSVRDGAKKKQVAGTAYEGTYIHKRGDYYYLFASIGSCCEGLKSTYTTVVGRSDSLFGPYTDKQGRPMMENHHEVLIHGNDAFVGTGHNSEIVTDDRGNDWVLYHAVSREHPTGRVLMLDRIRWRDGWPEVEGASPSLEAEAPEFIN